MNAQQAPAIPTTNIKLMNAAASLLFGLVLLAAVAALLWWFARLPMFALSGIRVTGQTAHSSVYVLRNRLAQNAIERAEQGDYSALDRLFVLLSSPCELQPDLEKPGDRQPPEPGHKGPSISCSS